MQVMCRRYLVGLMAAVLVLAGCSRSTPLTRLHNRSNPLTQAKTSISMT